MRNISFSFLLLVVSLFFSVQNVPACECAPLEPAEAFENAEAVFIGVIEANGGLFVHHSTFEVETSWKPIDSNKITVYNSKGCDPVGALEGSRYLVYANEDNGRLYMGRCTRTSPIFKPEDAEKDLKFLQTKAIEIIPGTGLLSVQNLKTGLIIAAIIIVLSAFGFLLNKFGYV